jgi:hypothetical protein
VGARPRGVCPGRREDRAVKLEKGKFYKTRAGARVKITSGPDAGGACSGTLYRSGLVNLASMGWLSSGNRFSNRSSENDLVEEALPPYSVWVMQTSREVPMPAPSEEIALRWARTSGGRAFRMMEVIE